MTPFLWFSIGCYREIFRRNLELQNWILWKNDSIDLNHFVLFNVPMREENQFADLKYVDMERAPAYLIKFSMRITEINKKVSGKNSTLSIKYSKYLGSSFRVYQFWLFKYSYERCCWVMRKSIKIPSINRTIPLNRHALFRHLFWENHNWRSIGIFRAIWLAQIRFCGQLNDSKSHPSARELSMYSMKHAVSIPGHA